MDKSIKLSSTASRVSQSSRDHSKKRRPITLKTIVIITAIVLSFAALISILVFSFYFNTEISQALIASLFIVSCILFIKVLSDEKTTIQKSS